MKGLGKAARNVVSSGRPEITKSLRRIRLTGRAIELCKVGEVQIPGIKIGCYKPFLDSLVLTSFSGAVVAVLHILLLISFWIGSVYGAIVTIHSGPAASWVLAMLGTATWLLFYRAALPAHRDAGAEFRAIVDCVISRFVEWALAVKAPLAEAEKTKIEALTEYLKIPNNR